MEYQKIGFSNVLLSVYAPYSIKERRGEKIIVGNRSNCPDYVNPLSVIENIVNHSREILKDKNNEEIILEFCNKYGLIGIYGGYEAHSWFKVIDQFIDECWNLSICIISFSILPHAFQGLHSHNIFSIAKPSQKKTGNEKRIEQMEKWSDTLKDASGGYHFSFPFEDQGFFAQYLEGFLQSIAFIAGIAERIRSDSEDLFVDEKQRSIKRKWLALDIDSLLVGVNVKCTTRKGLFANTFDYKTLNQALGIYFNYLVLMGKGLKRCKYCGNLFEPTNNKQEHCPPNPDNPTTYIKTSRGLLSRCKVNHDTVERAKVRKEKKR
ncbi:MAG: hypothetical protein AB2L14_27480 [Candidatus Xenobiia bacterium LiM19]